MAMTLSDQKKLIDAGYTIFRLELERKLIKTSRTPGSWRKYGEYRTKRDCQSRWNFLMMNNKYIGA